MTATHTVSTAACIALVLHAAVNAQRLRPRPPVAGGVDLLGIADRADGDPGPAVRMLESPNIDLYLRRAQDLLAREDFSGAIAILQAVIEGRTLDRAEDGEEPGEAPRDDGRPTEVAADDWQELTADPANTVFSADDRLYRPVRRLCHEFLASLPPEGIGRYRAEFDVRAEQSLVDAEERSDLAAVEQVFERFFVTRAAAAAMASAGDRHLDRGEFRAAIQIYDLLLETCPAGIRREAGVSDPWTSFKIALCHEQLGNPARAREVVAQMATRYPEQSLRVMGELVPIAALPDSDLLHDEVAGRSPAALARIDVDPRQGLLIPLWEHRFVEPSPYAASKVERNQRFVVAAGQDMTPTPKHNQFVPGRSVTFLGDELVVFLDHFRTRCCESLTGRLRSEDEAAEAEPPPPRADRPRSRIPAYDFATGDVAHDGKRLYVTIGGPATDRKGMRPVLSTRIVAYDRETLERLWDTSQVLGLRDITFLATPTVVGARLLVPVVRGGTCLLQCLDAASGDSIYRVPLHGGGTRMARPPASPVVVDGTAAYVLTNAGVLAAVDAHTGSLRWIRRYERVHPLRKPPPSRATRTAQVFLRGVSHYEQVDLYGFAPSPILAVDGMVVIAPSDSRVLQCLDGASGQPIWMIRDRIDLDDSVQLEYLVGHDGERVFVGTRTGVLCVGLHTGVRLWHEQLSSRFTLGGWGGRGQVVGDLLLMPGDRSVLIRSTTGGEWTELPLPTPLVGREPLSGPFNIAVDGALLALTFESGIAVFSTDRALRALAAAASDPIERTRYLTQVGDLSGAIEVLLGTDPENIEALGKSREVSGRLLALAGDLAVVMATHGARGDALALLDRCRSRLVGHDHETRWHLARLDVFRTLGDQDAAAGEQDALHRALTTR